MSTHLEYDDPLYSPIEIQDDTNKGAYCHPDLCIRKSAYIKLQIVTDTSASVLSTVLNVVSHHVAAMLRTSAIRTFASAGVSIRGDHSPERAGGCWPVSPSWGIIRPTEGVRRPVSPSREIIRPNALVVVGRCPHQGGSYAQQVASRLPTSKVSLK